MTKRFFSFFAVLCILTALIQVTYAERSWSLEALPDIKEADLQICVYRYEKNGRTLTFSPNRNQLDQGLEASVKQIIVDFDFVKSSETGEPDNFVLSLRFVLADTSEGVWLDVFMFDNHVIFRKTNDGQTFAY